MAGALGGGGIVDTPKEEQSEQAHESSRVVSEELIWRARAVRAEARADELEKRVAELESELDATKSAVGKADQRRALELELALAGAVDIETAAMVAEGILGKMDEPSVKKAVAELRASKPFLFAASAPLSAMSTRISPPSPRDVLKDLEDEARDSGDRSALLRYLRARRGA